MLLRRATIIYVTSLGGPCGDVGFTRSWKATIPPLPRIGGSSVRQNQATRGWPQGGYELPLVRVEHRKETRLRPFASATAVAQLLEDWGRRARSTAGLPPRRGSPSRLAWISTERNSANAGGCAGPPASSGGLGARIISLSKRGLAGTGPRALLRDRCAVSRLCAVGHGSLWGRV